MREEREEEIDGTSTVAGCAEVRVVSDLGAVFSPISASSFLPSSLPSFHTSFHAHASFLSTLPRFLPSFLFDPSVSLPACCSLNHLALHLPHISPAYLVTLLFLLLFLLLLFLFLSLLPPPSSSWPPHAPPYLPPTQSQPDTQRQDISYNFSSRHHHFRTPK